MYNNYFIKNFISINYNNSENTEHLSFIKYLQWLLSNLVKKCNLRNLFFAYIVAKIFKQQIACQVQQTIV